MTCLLSVSELTTLTEPGKYKSFEPNYQFDDCKNCKFIHEKRKNKENREENLHRRFWVKTKLTDI